MYCLNKVFEKNYLVHIQRILLEPIKTFVCLFEKDGSLLSQEIHPSFSCSCLSNGEGLESANKESCYDLLFKMPEKAIGSTHAIRQKCPCAIDIFILPIKYNKKVIGYLSVGVPRTTFNKKNGACKTKPLPADLSESAASRLSLELRRTLKNQLKEACTIISKSYAERVECQIANAFLSRDDYNSLFTSIVNESSGCITVLKKSGKDLRIAFANNFTVEYYRVDSFDKIKGKSLKELLPDYENIKHIFFKTIETGEPLRIKEFMFKDPFTNTPSWWNINISPYYKNGKIVGCISLRHEITEHVLSRTSLQELSNQFQEKSSQLEAVIDNMSEGFVFCDKNGNYLIWNKAALKILEVPKNISNVTQTKNFLSLKELRGKKIPLKDFPVRRVFRGETIKDYVLVAELKNESRDKKVLLFNGKPIYDKNNEFMFGLVTFSDITEITEQNNKIQEHWDLINRALDQQETPIFVVTYPDLKFVLANKQTGLLVNSTKTKRLPKNGIINQKISSVLNLNNIYEIEEYLLEIGKSNFSSSDVRTVTINIKNETKYFSVIITPLQNSNGKTTHIICSAFEITRSIQYSKKLEEISRLKEEFFANVSHEFRTPLTVILGSLQMLTTIEPHDDPETHRHNASKYLGIIKQNCNRLIKLTNNLLDVTRIDSGYLLLCLQKHDIVTHVKEITLSVSDYIAQKNISLSFSSNVKEKEMAIDSDKIERIILNLLSNAVKFTPKGNKITVSLRDKGNFVEIRVKDTGIGIPSNKLNIIFERFRQADNLLTRKNEGSGLGLALVKSLVELHGGTIKVKSKVGKGTEFIVSLPCLASDEYVYTSSNLNPVRDISEVISIEFSDLNLK